MGQLVKPPAPALVDPSGRALTPPREVRLTAVGFLRKLAEDAGGIGTARGQAIHQACGHMIKLQEELIRVGKLKDLSGEHTPEILDAAAEGIYNVACDALRRATGQVPDSWEVVKRERPGEVERYTTMAVAALGGPVFTPVATEFEAGHK